MFQTYNPDGCVDNQGMFLQVKSRCSQQQQRTAYDSDRITFCHEMVHQLNSGLRNEAGGHSNAFFIGENNGWYVGLTEPDVTLKQVADLVSRDYQNSAYDLYLVQQQRYWNSEPLYVLDELSAYTAGSLVAIEEGLNNHGSHERTMWFAYYARCVELAVLKHDPQYAELEQLQAFVAWQNDRIGKLFRDVV